MNEVAKQSKCIKCGATLTNKELLTLEIYGEAMCDICMGEEMRRTKQQALYKEKFNQIPKAYTIDVFDSNTLGYITNNSVMLIAEDSPKQGTQWLWDAIKTLWRKEMPAKYVSSVDISAEYSSMSWSDKAEYVDMLSATDGLLCIDDVKQGAGVIQDLVQRIVGYRAEHGLHTAVVIHFGGEDISGILGDKVMEIINSSWRCISLGMS